MAVSMEVKVAVLETKLDAVDVKVTSLQKEVSAIQGTLKNGMTTRQKDMQKSLNALIKNVDDVEEATDSNTDNIDSILSKIDERNAKARKRWSLRDVIFVILLGILSLTFGYNTVTGKNTKLGYTAPDGSRLEIETDNPEVQ